MTPGSGTMDCWREADGGFRGSRLLAAGAVLLAVGALLGLAAGSRTPGISHQLSTLRTTAWAAYALGLALQGAGFFWVGTQRILTRFGLVAGSLHFIQVLYLLVLVFGQIRPPVDSVVLTVGRLLAITVFSWLAANALGRRTAWILGGAAGLMLAKVTVRILSPRLASGPALDTVLLLTLAAATLIAARRVREIEDDWARRHLRGGKSDFREFNNPEHVWNKGGDRPGLLCAGWTR